MAYNAPQEVITPDTTTVSTTTLNMAYKLDSAPQIEDYIISRAMIYGVNPKLAVSIAKAESNFDCNAKNKGSTASGCFQFIDGTFKGFCIDGYKLTDTMEDKNNGIIQIECAVKMLSQGGVTHWEASRQIWSKLLAKT